MSREDLATCYFPNRAIDLNSLPCNSSAQLVGRASACCRANDACYESGACFQDWSGVMYRQSCTDPSFRDPACPQMCLGEGMLTGGVWILTCEMGVGRACCQIGDSCCGNESSLFDFKPGYIRAVINGDGTNRLGPYVDDDGNVQMTSVVVSSSQTTRTSSASMIATSSAQPSEHITISSSSSSTTNPPSDPLPSSSFSSSAIAATATLAVLLGISLLAHVFIWLRRFRKMKQEPKPETFVGPQHQEQQQQTYVNSSAGNTYINETWQAPREMPGDMGNHELASTNQRHVETGSLGDRKSVV